MQAISVFAAVLAVFCLCNFGFGLEEPNVDQTEKVAQILKESSSKTLAFLGTWGDKIYFNSSETMDWDSAVSECQTAKMELVTIRSTEELSFLQDALDHANYGHWTSAKGAHVFTWADGALVDLPLTSSPVVEPLCIFVDSTRFAGYNCTYNLKPLCEHAA